jgi:hypothetical protein
MKSRQDRLHRIKSLLERKKREGNQLCWIKYNRHSTYNYDIENAEEDVAWMIYEIEKLREENDKYREFIDSLRLQMESELGLKKKEE